MNYQSNQIYNAANGHCQFWFTKLNPCDANDNAHVIHYVNCLSPNPVVQVIGEKNPFYGKDNQISVDMNVIDELIGQNELGKINKFLGNMSGFVKDILNVMQQQTPTTDINHDKRSVMQVTRYIRPINPEYPEYSNMFGVTLVFTLDYLKKLIHVGISVCNGDNFDRSVGRTIAESGNNCIKNLTMPDYIYDHEYHGSLVKWFFELSPEENENNPNAVYNVGRNIMNLAIDMYCHDPKYHQ